MTDYQPDEAISEFLEESYEGLDQLDQDLVALEENPTDKDLLAGIFRCIHTIKGTCGFFGFANLQSITHVGENLLARLRDGSLTFNPDMASALLTMVDAVRTILANIEATGEEGDLDSTELVTTLERLLEVPDHAKTEDVATEDVAAEADHSEAPLEEGVRPLGEVLVESGKTSASEVSAAIAQQKAGDPRHVGEILVEKHAVDSADVLDAMNVQAENRTAARPDSTIRVSVAQLDKLMNQVGELVLARNQILQFSTTQTDNAFMATCQSLNLITTELQEGVMKARMQPIDNVWNKFPRVVRDLANQCQKKVRIEMEGKETELDKTLIEAIKDPLTHIVRNSVDHGIEAPADRASAGKAAEGRLILRAYHEGGQVNIEIADDGGGIDPEKIKAKAVEKGVITKGRSAEMSDREAVNLVFGAGFSTAEKVTNVSGRGVGMDVVRTNIEKIGGTVDIQSQLGQGTTIKVKIPLTLAIIPALVVKTENERYAIPQVSLLELVRLEGEQAASGIEMIHGAPVYRLRGQLLPLIYLDRELKLRPTDADQDPEHQSDVLNIVVLQADDRNFGLVVDAILDTEEIVVKPLGKQINGVPAFSGATVMGDGNVALILDVLGLAQKASVVTEGKDHARADGDNHSGDNHGQRRTLLVFSLGEETRLAIPLSEVARLEEIPVDTVERAGSKQVVQYRGEIMPLVPLSTMLSYGAEPVADEQETTMLQVVVYSQDGQSVGVVVERILDIVDEVVTIECHAPDHLLLGSAVIQGKVTDLLDIEQVVRSYEPATFEAAA